MTQPTSIQGFFGGGGKTAKFPTVGTVVSGTVTMVHPPEPQTDIKTGAPIPGKEQVRIDLATDERDPDIDFDDGARTLYVKGWMRGAVGDALRRAGAGTPEIGGRLTVKFSGEKPSDVPGFNPTKLFEVSYEKPVAGAGAAGSFFNTSASGPVKPAGIDQRAWDAMDDATRTAVASTMSTLTDPPPF